MDRGLVAVNKLDGRLLFVSGYMFLNNIAPWYFATGMNGESMTKYIEAQYFNYKPANIRGDETSLCCLFYSDALRAEYRVCFSAEQMNVIGIHQVP